MSTPSILVTGATGFIGRVVAEECLRRGYRVRAPHRHLTPPANPGVEWISFAEAGTESVDAVIHCAAVRHRHGIPAQQYLDENIGMTAALLKAMKGRTTRFVLVSSISVFGWPEKLPISDENAYAPVGPYGQSKVECEKLVRGSSLPYAIVRPSITYGPHDTNGMIEKLLRLLRVGKFRVVGSGKNRLQLVYSEDLAWATVEAAVREGLDGAEFTCTYQDPISMSELTRLSAEAVGCNPPWPNMPILGARAAATALRLLEKLNLSTGEPLVTHEKIDMVTVDRAYDISRMRELLSWAPPTGYAQGLRQTANALAL